MNLEKPWLGEDVKHWCQSIRNGYTRAFILFALVRTGVIALLRESNGLTSEEIAAKTNIDAHLLDGILNYLAFADRILVKRAGRFSLTPEGREWLSADPLLAFLNGGVGAYSCLLTELVPALRGEKQYGRDFVRDGELLAIGSHHTGRHVYPWVVAEMKKLGVTTVADLGCGSADVLISLCELEPTLRGVGLDIDRGALVEAQRRLVGRGLSDRVRLVEADLQRPDTFAEQLKGVDAFNAIMVVHEFMRDGTESVVELLRQFRRHFPGKYMFLGEFDRLADEEWEAIPYPDRLPMLFYQYVIHPLSLQGLPAAKAAWLDVFERAGVEVVKVKEGLGYRLNIYVLRF